QVTPLIVVTPLLPVERRSQSMFLPNDLVERVWNLVPLAVQDFPLVPEAARWACAWEAKKRTRKAAARARSDVFSMTPAFAAAMPRPSPRDHGTGSWSGRLRLRDRWPKRCRTRRS